MFLFWIFICYTCVFHSLSTHSSDHLHYKIFLGLIFSLKGHWKVFRALLNAFFVRKQERSAFRANRGEQCIVAQTPQHSLLVSTHPLTSIPSSVILEISLPWHWYLDIPLIPFINFLQLQIVSYPQAIALNIELLGGVLAHSVVAEWETVGGDKKDVLHVLDTPVSLS